MVETIYRLYGTETANRYLRQRAQSILGYYVGHVKADYSYSNVKGEKTAREWIRLIDEREPSQAELLALLGVAHANKHCGSMWLDLAGHIHFWLELKGVSLPPRNEFFASDQIPFEKSQVFTPLDYANWLIEHFMQNCVDDPGYEPWIQGLAIAREWLRMINVDKVTEANARSLVEKMINSDEVTSGSALWFDLEVGITKWCKTIGYLQVVPEDWRNYVK